ncbi:hypothetical protein PIB30_035810 [Stylosanthes scabra]|uniref:Uncharacterized protein n=1 Tax=Stylosanthes scabra TaxID=79078 RepID=A0ABU6XES6_9FABA|nr:hypothetical protein [Stylosanthes scabra]
MARLDKIFVTVYPNDTPREGSEMIDFHSSNQVVFLMWPVKTLENLKKPILMNMRLLELTPIIRIAYEFLAVLSDKSCRYRVFWPCNDEHVQTMFAGHERILSEQVIQLKFGFLRRAQPLQVAPPPERTGEEFESDGDYVRETDGGNSTSSKNECVAETPVGKRFLLLALFPIPNISTMQNHFHMLRVDAMEDKQLEFQAFHYSYHHVIAACASTGLDWGICGSDLHHRKPIQDLRDGVPSHFKLEYLVRVDELEITPYLAIKCKAKERPLSMFER